MEENGGPLGAQDAGPAPKIEVHLTPEFTRDCLTLSLRRTRRRAVRMLEELLRAAQAPRPDVARIRHLAEGIQFEMQLARQIAATLAQRGPEA